MKFSLSARDVQHCIFEEKKMRIHTFCWHRFFFFSEDRFTPHFYGLVLITIGNPDIYVGMIHEFQNMKFYSPCLAHANRHSRATNLPTVLISETKEGIRAIERAVLTVFLRSQKRGKHDRWQTVLLDNNFLPPMERHRQDRTAKDRYIGRIVSY